MLSDEIIDRIVDRLVARVRNLNTYTLTEFGKSVNKIKKAKLSDVNKLAQIMRYGEDYEKIVNEIARVTDLNIRDIYKIFDEVAKIDYNFSKPLYEYRNIDFVSYENNKQLQQQVRILAKQAANEYFDLSRTLAFAVRNEKGALSYTELSRTYQNLIDQAVLSVGNGEDNFNQQMYRTIKQLNESGIRSVDYPSGRSMRLDSAVRMCMKSGIQDLHNEMQEQIGQEIHSNGVEISVHENPAPDHADVQGKQFSKKQFNNFQNDKRATSYDGIVFEPEHDGRDRRSISDFNCYHYIFDIILGVNQPQYTNEQLKEINQTNNKGFDFDGKHYTMYEGTQLQRKLETEIRKQKDLQIMARQYNDSDLINQSQQKITQLTRKYKQLSEVSGLPTELERARVSGYHRVKAK